MARFTERKYFSLEHDQSQGSSNGSNTEVEKVKEKVTKPNDLVIFSNIRNIF